MNTLLNWYHALFLGNVLANLTIVVGFFRYVHKRYLAKRHLYEQFVREHDEMWEDYCARNRKIVDKESRLQLT